MSEELRHKLVAEADDLADRIEAEANNIGGSNSGTLPAPIWAAHYATLIRQSARRALWIEAE